MPVHNHAPQDSPDCEVEHDTTWLMARGACLPDDDLGEPLVNMRWAMTGADRRAVLEILGLPITIETVFPGYEPAPGAADATALVDDILGRLLPSGLTTFEADAYADILTPEQTQDIKDKFTGLNLTWARQKDGKHTIHVVLDEGPWPPADWAEVVEAVTTAIHDAVSGRWLRTVHVQTTAHEYGCDTSDECHGDDSVIETLNESLTRGDVVANIEALAEQIRNGDDELATPTDIAYRLNVLAHEIAVGR